ncbi:U11/U12 small nuclear ribonucleoprotein 48 kDa protein-like isoform X2 [Mytilus californianus]|nr:U11/U12 small nuclear ribonucleoprotein 48 kDa protein-like isoform X2 [Mytilus californianus]XP_052106822.1 U11/U12 small nuclear ribonucleoprotein 48 kDa protein-like isoform X2 [Mytilus californianus]
MMEYNMLEDRDSTVRELQDYLKECQNEVTHILEYVGWTPEHFIKQDDIVSCSFDSSHRMPRKYLTKHEEKCELLYVGYKKEDLADVIGYTQDPTSSSVHIDRETMNRVLRDHHVQNHSIFFAQDKVPLTPNEVTVQLTPAERAAIHDYVVEKAKNERRLNRHESDQFLSTDLQEMVKQKDALDRNKPKSYMEYLAQQRDYKRRRQSYRAKNVHITRKSYTEIIREVIENQTEYVAMLRQEEAESAPSRLEEKPDESDELDDLNEEEKEDIKDNGHRGRSKVKKKKKHKKHKHKHTNKSASRSKSRSRSESRSRYRSRSRQ